MKVATRCSTVANASKAAGVKFLDGSCGVAPRVSIHRSTAAYVSAGEKERRRIASPALLADERACRLFIPCGGLYCANRHTLKYAIACYSATFADVAVYVSVAEMVSLRPWRRNAAAFMPPVAPLCFAGSPLAARYYASAASSACLVPPGVSNVSLLFMLDVRLSFHSREHVGERRSSACGYSTV